MYLYLGDWKMSAKRITVHAISIEDVPGSMHSLLVHLAVQGVDLNGMIVSSVGDGKGAAYISAKDSDALAACLKEQNISAVEMTAFLITGKDRIGSVANAIDPLNEAGINGVAGAAMVCDNKFGMLIVVDAEQGDAAQKALA
jgi:hypothetical protein